MKKPGKTPSIWLMVGLGVVAVVGILALNAGDLIRVFTEGDELRAAGQRTMAEARVFGDGKAADACIGEGLKRLDACRDGICRAHSRVFLTSCLETATLPADFCRGVPAPDDLTASAQWSLAACSDLGRTMDDDCARFVRAYQQYTCHPSG